MNFRIKLSKIEINKGQIQGVPSNPRQWKKAELEKLKASIQEDPDMMEARPLLVYQMGETYVVIGGNMRYTAVKQLGWKDVPCYVITETVDILTLKRWAIKDNGSFGEWDMDMLANEWDDLPLTDWGVPAWDTEPEKEEEPEAKEDDFDEEKDCIEVRCKPGDIWQLGNHRLMCGDSIDLEQVKKLMGGGESYGCNQ